MLTTEQLRLALAYNRSQEYSPEQIVAIGRVLGVEVGRPPVWCPRLVRAVVDFQSSNRVAVDGKVWRDEKGNTWPLLLARMTSRERQPAPLSLSLWIDDAPSMVIRDSYLDGLAELGVQQAAVMVNRANTRAGSQDWVLNWSIEELLSVTRALKSRGIRPSLTFWPRPNPATTAALLRFAGLFVAHEPVAAIELDAEGNWTEGFVQGYATLHDAGVNLVRSLRQLVGPATSLELTSYPYHGEFGVNATLSPLVDVLFPQAYSVYSEKGAKWNDRHGPGGLQEVALSLARRIKGAAPEQTPELGCGLAAYGQVFPGHNAHEAMKRALDVTRANGVSQVRYWSSKWVVGHRANGYAGEYLRGLRRLPGEVNAPPQEV